MPRTSKSDLLPHEKQAIAYELRDLYKQHGTEQAVADLLKVSQSAVAKGKKGSAGLFLLGQIQAATGQSLSDLVTKHKTDLEKRGRVTNDDNDSGWKHANLRALVSRISDLLDAETMREVRRLDASSAPDLSEQDWLSEVSRLNEAGRKGLLGR